MTLMIMSTRNLTIVSAIVGVAATVFAVSIPSTAEAAINPGGQTAFFSEMPGGVLDEPATSELFAPITTTPAVEESIVEQAATPPPVSLAAPTGLEAPVATPVDPAPEIRKKIPTQLETLKATRWAKVVLHEQRTYFYENGRIIKSVRISSGLPGTPTNVGEHKIFRRVYNERMAGCCPEYDLSNVLYTQYFDLEYEAFHYAYWHNNFGAPQSHGCVNMTLSDSKWLWDWAYIGMRVSVVN